MGLPGSALATALYSVAAIGAGTLALLMLIIAALTKNKLVDILVALTGAASLIAGTIAGAVYIEAGIFGYEWSTNQGLILYSIATTAIPIGLGVMSAYYSFEETR